MSPPLGFLHASLDVIVRQSACVLRPELPASRCSHFPGWAFTSPVPALPLLLLIEGPEPLALGAWTLDNNCSAQTLQHTLVTLLAGGPLPPLTSVQSQTTTCIGGATHAPRAHSAPILLLAVRLDARLLTSLPVSR